MKKLIFILFMVVWSGTTSAGEASAALKRVFTATVEEVPTNNNCAWWRLPNQDFNGVPKYSGSFCTYTHKHIPVATYGNGDIFYTTTDNTLDDNFYIYAHKGDEKVLVHQIDNWNDPHTNAAIQIDNEGHVNVHVASRGLSHKFKSGKILKSKTPYSLDFECIDGCDNVNFEAYPQVFDTSFGYYVGYTHYVKDPTIHASRNIREIWYRIGDKRTRIAKGGHYANTYYHNGTVYVFFNFHKNGNADLRHNLYGIKTTDGINWKSMTNKALSLPLEQDDLRARVYETESKGNNVYLKDLTWRNGIRALFTEATTKDPTQGQRFLKEWNTDDEYPVLTVTETNHNYSAGAYIKAGNDTYILTNSGTETDYLGGPVSVYKMFSTTYELTDKLTSGNYSYIRKVYGVDGYAVAGKGEGDAFISSEHVMLKLNLQ